MGASKRYKGKDCPYCGLAGVTTTADHVIARAFFFEEDRTDIPKVPACAACNNTKSHLEEYVAATLMIGSQHPEGDRYRQEMVRPRLDRNQKLRQQLRLDDPPEWVKLNGIFQPMHAVTIEAGKVTELMNLIVRGLYLHHFKEVLPPEFFPQVSMFHPDHEAGLWAQVSPYFPPDAPRVRENFGRGTFSYAGARSPAHSGFSAWQLAWHGGIQLHGRNGEAGADHWWAFTRPTSEALAAAKEGFAS